VSWTLNHDHGTRATSGSLIQDPSKIARGTKGFDLRQ
jgi:hypothetical protein